MWKPALIVVLAAAMLGVAAASPILGVSPYFTAEEHTGAGDAADHGVLVITTGAPEANTRVTAFPEDVVPLNSPKERSRFLVTLLMLESLRDKPGSAAGVGVHAKLQSELLADEEVMQEVLQLYESQQESKGKHYIKIPPKLMKKIKNKMKELLSE